MSDENVVKWLYPGAAATQGDNTSISDMESELQTDQSVQGSPFDHSAAMDNSSPTNSGPDSEAASIDDLPRDETKAAEDGYIPEDISNKMAAATTYMGSFFNPSAWKAEKSPEEGEAKEGKPATTSRKNSATGGMMGSSFLSAFGKVPGFTKVSPTEEEKPTKEGEAPTEGEKEEGDKEKEESAAQGSFFSSAFSKIGISGMASSLTMENIAGKAAPAATAADTEEDKDKEIKESDDKKDETWGSSFSNAFTKVGKVATDYTKVVQDTVYKAPMLAEFNQEQEEFIKSKGEKEMPTAPWSGYQNEDELKDKILALSEDKRNFLRAPPTGVNFDF
eukprot:TRINITY_DN7731_c0_g1_i1.p1 TRINITY_DN7731_c0_g1~~TRINITY_DN7731_c0_g1_i1.p1  ORF type:complete len:334 (+),score=128.29 TRINITY_DN7731_c0_g1_i1:283-1284(+)